MLALSFVQARVLDGIHNSRFAVVPVIEVDLFLTLLDCFGLSVLLRLPL